MAAALLQGANRAYAEQRWADCERAVQQVLTAQPQSVQGWRLAGALAFRGARLAQAQAAFEKVLELPGSATDMSASRGDDWLNLASALDQPQRPDLAARAEEAYRKALECQCTQRDALLRQLSALFRAQYRFDEARALWQPELDAALAHGDRARQAQIENALGAVALEQSGWHAAMPYVQSACEADPTYAEAQFSRALGLLASGDFAAGWAAHEWRWKVSQAQGTWRDYGAPWAGDALGERILLVWAEQGLGDALQFARFLPQLRAAHPQAGLLFVCSRVLHPVLADLAARHQISLMPAEEALPGRVRGHDLHVPLLSLPLYLHCSLDKLPPPAALAVNEERAQVWRERMARFSSEFFAEVSPDSSTSHLNHLNHLKSRSPSHAKITPALKLGLVWSGSNAQAMAQRRNLRLADLEPLLSVPGVQWHSLQLGPPAGEIATSAWQGRIVDWSHHLHDFGDTAALANCLDGIVSVDTSCVHLAASLGLPTFMLSRFDACWRWMREGSETPWYPTMRIFRQAQPGAWAPVLESLRAALNRAVAANAFFDSLSPAVDNQA